MSARAQQGVTSFGSLAFRGLAVALLFGLLAGGLTAAEQGLQPGDRVVFLGDSITQGGAAPGGYVTLAREAINKYCQDLGVEVIGAGISGNRVPDLEQRLERDVLSKKPTIVAIYIGINDVWHSIHGRGTPKDAYEQGLKNLIQQINDAGARVILCTASVIGEKRDGANDLDKMLDEYCEISRQVAADTKSQLLDLRKEFLSYLQRSNPDNAAKNILTTDGVHLNAKGNRFVADKMLAALGVNTHPGQVLRHVVLFKFKEGVTAEQIQEVVDGFVALPTKIDVVSDFEYGTDVSVESMSQGFTHGFVVTFRNEQGRDTYLPHAVHQEFVKLVGPRLDKAFVFDYWANQPAAAK
jgi:lysophospholipase L1-like esterase